MKKVTTILGLMLVSSTVFAYPTAIPTNILGEYSSPSGVRFFGYTEADCKSEGGNFELEDEAEKTGVCYLPANDTISITNLKKDKNMVSVDVIWGPGNQRSFTGFVTIATENVIFVREAEMTEDGAGEKLMEDGCRMILKVKNNEASILNLSDTCDSDLARASGAVKK